MFASRNDFRARIRQFQVIGWKMVMSIHALVCFYRLPDRATERRTFAFRMCAAIFRGHQGGSRRQSTGRVSEVAKKQDSQSFEFSKAMHDCHIARCAFGAEENKLCQSCDSRGPNPSFSSAFFSRKAVRFDESGGRRLSMAILGRDPGYAFSQLQQDSVRSLSNIASGLDRSASGSRNQFWEKFVQ